MKRLVFCVVMLLLAVSSSADARIVESFKVRGWHGDAFVSDKTGAFSSCIAIARYRSQISMSVEVNANYNWWIGFSAPGWTMTPGEKIPLQYRIDRGAWQQGTAVAVSAELARMPMPADGYIIKRFRRGRVMYVTDRTNNYSFKLTGTSRMLARLASCVKKNSGRYGTAPSAAAPPPSSVPKPGTSKPGEVDLVIESTQALFNVMGELNVRDIKFINAAGRDEALRDLYPVAANDARTMAAHIFEKGSFESEKVILSNIIGAAEKACEGDFASGSGSKGVDGTTLHVGYSACTAGDVEIADQYVVMQRPRGGVFVYVLSDTSVGEGGGSPSAPSVPVGTAQFHSAVLKAAP